MDKSEPTEVDDFGWIPLHFAAHLGDKELVNCFWKMRNPLLTLRTMKACLPFTFQLRKDMLVL